MKNQLFKISPDIIFTIKLLNFFGIQSLQDNHVFTKQDLIRLKTKQNLTDNLSDINQFYLPCKSKLYLTNIDEKKCITILRQFLKIHNYSLKSNQKYIYGEKNLIYQVIPILQNEKNKNNKNYKNNKKLILLFD